MLMADVKMINFRFTDGHESHEIIVPWEFIVSLLRAEGIDEQAFVWREFAQYDDKIN